MTTLIINSVSLPIQTVSPSLCIGEVMLSADKRSSRETGVIADAERIRRVVLPVAHWQELAATMDGAKSQGLTDILRDALKRIGSDRLRDTLAETPMATTVPVADYTIAALLAWSEDTASSRGSITFTREQVEAWFTASATLAALVAKWTAAGKTAAQCKQLTAFASNRFAALAAKNHGLKDAADADKLLSLMHEDDAATAIGTDIAGRIAHISKALTAKAADATVSMDDL